MSRERPLPPSVKLTHSGFSATIESDSFIPGGYQLIVDGTPQSHVNTADPTALFFDYIQRMGHLIDLIKQPGEPITAVHFGAGALTLPRYIEATRPGSTQQVIELEPQLVDLVRKEIPWPKKARIRVRYGDAREVIPKLPKGLYGTADLIVLDIFAGARIPAHVTSQEFYAGVSSLLAADGLVLINNADGPGLAFTRSHAATIASVVPHVFALAEKQVLAGRRFGNVVVVASPQPFPPDWMPRIRAGGPHPATVMVDEEFAAFIKNAPIITDTTAVPSPLPGRTVFQLR